MQFIDHRPWFSYRGLTPNQFLSMLGAHKLLHADTYYYARFCVSPYSIIHKNALRGMRR